jgi:hypothetical protein
MVMLLFAAALIAAIPAPAIVAPDSKAPAAKNCPRTTNYYAWQRGKSLRPHKLNELPPANAYSAVYRRIGECEVPIVVKYGIGGR